MAENDQKSGKASWWQPAIMTFVKLSVWIAGPIILAVFLGKWLDEKYGTDPWLFLICVGVAFVLSMVGLVMNTLTEFKKIEQAEKEKKDK